MTVSRLLTLVPLSAVLAGAVACTALPPPLAPLARPAYPDFVYPAAPNGTGPDVTARIDAGWRSLQRGDFKSARQEFAAAAKRDLRPYPAVTGVAYAALAGRDYVAALKDFDAALTLAPTYAPALAGRGQTLLALHRDAEALRAFEAALASDSSLEDVRARIDVLRFRGADDVVADARAAAGTGRLDDARAAYGRALAASPDTGFLHREFGIVERRRGDANAALTQLRRATELDPSDAGAFIQVGEILEERGDFAGAEAAYVRAGMAEPTEALTRRLANVRARVKEAARPAEYRAIETVAQLTRGDLAALIGIRLEDLLTATGQPVVMTDVGGHWAAPWIASVARAQIIDPFANHTFQPRARIGRGDLANAVSRLLMLIASGRADLRTRWAVKPAIADVDARHLSYPAVSVAVASGVMPLPAGGRFEPSAPVSGAEAIAVIDRVRALMAVSQ